MIQIDKLASACAVVCLAAGAALFAGCKSNGNDTNPNTSNGPTMSGSGGGNGSMGESPSHAMHSNPADTQPAK